MVCLYCSHRTKTTNSRNLQNGHRTWRRKKCTNCSQVWTTIEKPDLSKLFSVKHISGKLEPFSRDKLFLTVFDSLKHREAAQSDATSLTDTILNKVLIKSNASIIEAEIIFDATLEVLDRFDTHAAAHYRAYNTT